MRKNCPHSLNILGIELDEEENLIEEYQAITESEERDLDLLMSSCQTAISNAEAFMENLAKDLSLLDGVLFIHE